MQNRKRLSPKTLAAKQPIAKFIVDRFTPLALGGKRCGDSRFDFGGRLRIKLAAVDRFSFGNKTNVAGQNFVSLFVVGWWIDNRNDLQTKRFRKLKIAFVVSRHSHDRAGTVTGQHVVGDPDGDGVSVDGIDRVAASKDTRFAFFATVCSFTIALKGCLFAVRFHFRFLAVRRQRRNHRMLGRDHHVGCTEQSIRTRCVNAQRIFACVGGEPRFRTR